MKLGSLAFRAVLKSGYREATWRAATPKGVSIPKTAVFPAHLVSTIAVGNVVLGRWGLFGAIGVIRAGGAIQNAIFPTRGWLLIFAVQHTDLNGRTDLLCTQVRLAVDDQKIDANLRTPMARRCMTISLSGHISHTCYQVHYRSAWSHTISRTAW